MAAATKNLIDSDAIADAPLRIGADDGGAYKPDVGKESEAGEADSGNFWEVGADFEIRETSEERAERERSHRGGWTNL